MVLQLQCAVQQYAWGKVGMDSTVARLIQEHQPIDEAKPYAELWMGTHSSGPSMIVGDPEWEGKSLDEWISHNPESLGKKVTQTFGKKLPFLFKVLSVGKALSIQAHPTKEHAEQLHRERPDLYPDANHKPEIAVALTKFEALCGFRPWHEICQFLTDVPELQAVIGNAANKALIQGEDGNEAGLKQCFVALMTCPEERFKQNLQDLVNRLSGSSEKELSPTEKLLLKLHLQFPGDVGCFSVFFLNFIILQPGEAIFLAANEPHAYLAGDCIECMACSDNVVRAGLTPKYKDVSTLCEMLTYHCRSPQENIFPGKLLSEDACTTVFDPPVPDFTVAVVKVPPCMTSYSLHTEDSGSIGIVLHGEAMASTRCSKLHLKYGSVVFIPAGEEVQLDIQSQGLLLARAYCHL